MIVLQRVFSAWAALAAMGVGSAGIAQDKEPASFPVAIVNLDVLFKQDPKVVKALEELKLEAAEIDEKVKLRQTELEAIASDIRKAQPGSQEQLRLQQQGAKLTAELQQYVARERVNVQLKEAKIYLSAYQDIEGVVKAYCKERGIKLVIRQQTTSLEENQPAQEIIKALNRIVVYEDGLDITEAIREQMKKNKP